jgi:hypothetical protein
MAGERSSARETDAEEAWQRVRFRSRVGTILLIAAVGLLLASLFLPWYTMTSTAAGGEQLHFLADGQASVTLDGVTISGTYSTAGLNTTGLLYENVEGMLIVSILGAGGAAFLAFAMPRRPDLRWAPLLLGLVIVSLATIAPLMVASQQPGALTADLSAKYDVNNPYSPFSSPTNTFIGQASTLTWSQSWGPDVGWGLSFFAGGVAIAGALYAFFARLPPGMAPTPERRGRGRSRDHNAPLEPPEPPPPRFEEEPDPMGYTCTTCGLHFGTFLEFHSHLKVEHAQRVVDR